MTCHNCGADGLVAFHQIGRFVPVSSDIRLVDGRLTLAACSACGLLQKSPELEWTGAVERLYAGYDLNHQSHGADPHIFRSLYGPGPRAELLIRHLSREARPAQRGRLLDVGCGNGNLLRAFSQSFPSWDLFGVERSGSARVASARVARVIAVQETLGQFGALRFDTIVLSHVLEHIPGPSAYLAACREALTVNGQILVAVPDIRQNPIDLFVLDHCSHFDVATIGSSLSAAALRAVSIRPDVLGKEIVAVARRHRLADGDRKEQVSYRMPPAAVVEKYLSLAAQIVEAARAHRLARATFGIVGTSTAGVWLAGELKGDVDFFADEDPSRVGSYVLGKPVLTLQDIPSGAGAFVPMSASTSEGIVARAARADVEFKYLPWNDIDDVGRTAVDGLSPTDLAG